MTILPHTAAVSGAWRALARAGLIATLLLLQLTVLDRFYHFPLAVAAPAPPLWAAVNIGLKWLAYAGLFGAVAFAVLALANGRRLGETWRAHARRRHWGRWLAGQCLLFIVLLGALPIFSAGAPSPPWLEFCAWLIAGAAMVCCAGLASAPGAFWRAFAAQSASAYWLALGVGALTFAALPLSQNSWDALSAATLHLSYAILQLYEPSARMVASEYLLGAGDFAVLVRAACSGYEGIALVLSMLGFYIYAFRKHLRFPHVLLLLPIGIAAIWLSNALRLALLVSFGAHISPQMALDGFHAQAGWVMFLAVTISLMALAHRMAFFRIGAQHSAGPDPALKLAAALLAPFAALMAARIGGAITQDLWVGAMLIVLPAGAIWFYRPRSAASLAQSAGRPGASAPSSARCGSPPSRQARARWAHGLPRSRLAPRRPGWRCASSASS